MWYKESLNTGKDYGNGGYEPIKGCIKTAKYRVSRTGTKRTKYRGSLEKGREGCLK
jgi:hypothetical protein